jgi:hypothetical protein
MLCQLLMSAFEGKADVLATPSELPLLARSRHTPNNRISPKIDGRVELIFRVRFTPFCVLAPLREWRGFSCLRVTKKQRRQVLGRESVLLASPGLFCRAQLSPLGQSARRGLRENDDAAIARPNPRTMLASPLMRSTRQERVGGNFLWITSSPDNKVRSLRE